MMKKMNPRHPMCPSINSQGFKYSQAPVPMQRPVRVWTAASPLGLTVALWLALTPGANAWDKPEEPARGEPYPGFERYVPYEDILDYSEIALIGKVIERRPYKAKLSLEQPEEAGHVIVEIQSVLKGEFTNRTATIVHGSGNLWGMGDTNKAYAFLCLRSIEPGTLRLAGDPPQGGGYISEGPAHLEELIEAARDPAKAYQSTNFPVKFSAAYRLVNAWLATPEKERKAPPDGLMATLLEGLWSYRYGLGFNADATAWNGINAILDCDIHSIWDYPPEMKKGRRSKLATDVAGAWERTSAAVRKQRAEEANIEEEGSEKLRLQVAVLIEQLASDDYPTRQAAQDALVAIGKPALKQVKDGTNSENPKVAAGCRLLSMLIGQLRDFRPDDQSHVFDLKLAAPFVPASAPKKESQ